MRMAIELMDPQQLYELWERQPWSAHAIDLEQDKRDWAGFSGPERDDLAWTLASFFVGEERVATQFTGLMAAYESQGEAAFLATQQVDEARHAQHFDRVYDQVMGLDGGFEGRLDQAREHLNEAFTLLFDQHLVQACDRLLADRTDREAKVDFVTAYHMVIEGTLALTGQHFVIETFERLGILPGTRQGFELIARDEHRHVAYGTWYLQRAAADPALKRRIQAKLVELVPIAAGVLVPPGLNVGDEYTVLGVSSVEQQQFALSALTRRLNIIGVPLEAPEGAGLTAS
jgi:ribonucleoside-diphosphate reductase beta chain